MLPSRRRLVEPLVAMSRYTPCYCEENIWWLCQEPRFQGLRAEVLIISNDQRGCALFCQRAAPAPGLPVVWDYHVVLATQGPTGTEIWDLDCTLGMPLSAEAWLDATFGPARALPVVFQPRFRVVEASAFVATFSSDRSHMFSPDGAVHAPPPPWPAILNGEPNLARFVDLQADFLGDVMDLEGLKARWGLSVSA